MGRPKKDPKLEAAMRAIAQVQEDPAFLAQLQIVDRILEKHEADRRRAKAAGDETARFPDWQWRRVTFEDGEHVFRGPHYVIRELCDDFGLPWPESAKIIGWALAAAKGADLARPGTPTPARRAWDTWRMAQKGLAYLRPDELEAAASLGHEQARDVADGLTYRTLASFLWDRSEDGSAIDERTIGQWVRDCSRYARAASINEVWEAAGLRLGELWALMRWRVRDRLKLEE